MHLLMDLIALHGASSRDVRSAGTETFLGPVIDAGLTRPCLAMESYRGWPFDL